MLGVGTVGIDDDFFHSGGDSVAAIQLIGVCRDIGVHVSLRDMREARTVRELARLCADRSAVTVPWQHVGGGEDVPLLPFMRHLLDSCDGVPKQSLTVFARTPASSGLAGVAQALQSVLDHHDMLRTRLVPADGGHWVLRVAALGAVRAEALVHRVCVSGLDAEAIDVAVEVAGRAALDQIDPEAGTMMRAVWFDLGPLRDGVTLLVAHRLVVDDVSLRILADDFTEACAAAEAGLPVRLAGTGTPFRTWAHHLENRALSEEVLAELPTWTAATREPDPLLGHRPPNRDHDVACTIGTHTAVLDAAHTAPILTTVPAVLGAEQLDVLLTTFTLAVSRWRRERLSADPGNSVLINVETHGREETVGDFDLSRTIGSFTTTAPYRLDAGDCTSDDLEHRVGALPRAVDGVMRQLRSVTHHGQGYGLLRYLTPKGDQLFAERLEPQISFRYAGRTTLPTWDLGPDKGVVELPSVGGVDPNARVIHTIMLDACTLVGPEGPVLVARWSWLSGVLELPEVQDLAEGWFDYLRAAAKAAGQGLVD